MYVFYLHFWLSELIRSRSAGKGGGRLTSVRFFPHSGQERHGEKALLPAASRNSETNIHHFPGIFFEYLNFGFGSIAVSDDSVTVRFLA